MSGRRARRDRQDESVRRIEHMADAMGLPKIALEWVAAYGPNDPLRQASCPGCGDDGVWLVAPSMVGQAFCRNDDCNVFGWDPRQAGGGPALPAVVTQDAHGGTHVRWEDPQP